MRGATFWRSISLCSKEKFQSTLPMRGATLFHPSGCDAKKDFNPHSPCGERQRRGNVPRLLQMISIHTPHAGSDGIGRYVWVNDVISIHTPHAGSDFCRHDQIVFLRHISIHTPHAGSDHTTQRKMASHSHFNPHSPCGERRQQILNYLALLDISIHTPHAGSDFSINAHAAQLPDFNPHSPCGERPHYVIGCVTLKISIHTPHAGSDQAEEKQNSKYCYFNPHSPCGERRWCTCSPVSTTHFNPHSPCGERPVIRGVSIMDIKISIHTPHAGSDSDRNR